MYQIVVIKYYDRINQFKCMLSFRLNVGRSRVELGDVNSLSGVGVSARRGGCILHGVFMFWKAVKVSLNVYSGQIKQNFTWNSYFFKTLLLKVLRMVLKGRRVLLINFRILSQTLITHVICYECHMLVCIRSKEDTVLRYFSAISQLYGGTTDLSRKKTGSLFGRVARRRENMAAAEAQWRNRE